LQIVERSRKAQQHLPLDRGRLLAVPVPARDESRTEYERAAKWKDRFADQFGELYRDWLPSGKTAHEAIDLLRIPYVPYWSFGETLPAIEEGTSDPASLGHAYEILARVLAARLDWYAALEGQTLAPPPSPRRELDRDWLERHRRGALNFLGRTGFMEVCHFSPDSSISRPQRDLLSAAKQARVPQMGWPIGVVLDNREEYRPRSIIDGILAIISLEGRFDYWTLTTRGDFYTLRSFAEDNRDEGRSQAGIFFDTRILRATEALLHCAILNRVLGVEPNAHIEMTVRYGGLRGRSLMAMSSAREFAPSINLHEDEVSIPPLTFRLSDVETEIVDLVKKLCEPLFVIFDFASFPDEVYRQIVSDFVKGKVG
jgi:hypothetical protein